jgi:cytochrome c oxidase assembly protein subunit 15
VGIVDASLPRLRRLAVSQELYRWLTLASAVMLIVIVASGASVRLTGSGLGCLDWPGCSAGHPLPTVGYHSDIEFSNRIISALTIVATLGAWIATLLFAGAPRWVRWVAGLAFVGTFAQAPLGAITVHYKLNPLLVGTHFLLTLVVLALGVIVALEAWQIRGEPVPLRIRQLSLLVGLSLAVLIVTGMLSTAAGPHSGSVDVPRIWRFHSAVWLHVRATAVFGLAFLGLIALLGLRASRHFLWALAVLGLFLVQMVVGEIQYRTHLPLGEVIVHVTLAAIIWAAAVVFIATMWRPWRDAPAK